MDWFQPCMVPDGQVGSARVERFTVSATEADLSLIQSWGSSVDAVPSGEYVGLYERGTLWMSNTPSEERDHIPPIRRARAIGGRCLVVGLGLGLVTEALLAVPSGTRVGGAGSGVPVGGKHGLTTRRSHERARLEVAY